MDGLGEQKFKEYGERLIKNILNFVETEELEEHLAKKRSAQPAKKRKASVAEPTAVGAGAKAVKLNAPSHNNNSLLTIEDDEFPLDFDVGDIVLPGDKPVAQRKSNYF